MDPVERRRLLGRLRTRKHRMKQKMHEVLNSGGTLKKIKVCSIAKLYPESVLTSNNEPITHYIEREEVAQIRSWAVEENITIPALDKLIKILRNNLIPELPETATDFINQKTVRSAEDLEKIMNVYQPSNPNSDNFIDVNNTPTFSLANMIDESGTDTGYHQNINAPQDLDAKTVYHKLTNIEKKLNVMCNSQEIMMKMIERMYSGYNMNRNENIANPVTTILSFAEKYNLSLPCSSYEEFQYLENQLISDKQCREDFQSSFAVLFDKDNILSRTITNIFRKYLSRSLAMCFTMSIKREGKHVLGETTFAKNILDYLSKQFCDNTTGQKVPLSAISTAMGLVLNGAKDWDGNRSLRNKK